MHKLFLILTLVFVSGLIGCGESETKESRKRLPIVRKRVKWLNSYEAAVTKSRETGKPIFAFFTGSDWCKYCSLMDEQILNTVTFANWSKENVVLLELDFPRNKQLEEPIARQNEELKNKYRISGFPTILFLMPDGTPVLQAGYHKVTAEQWIEVVEKKLKESLGNQTSQPSETQN